MANELKGITVRIDADLHAEIKKYLEDNNMTMAEFITHAVDDELHPKYIAQEENKVEKMRTLAFQVPEDLFQRIKGYLARTGMSQKNFVIGLIEEELDRDEEMRAAENTPEVQGEDTSEESADIAAGDIVDVVDETEDESETYGEGPEDPTVTVHGGGESVCERGGDLRRPDRRAAETASRAFRRQQGAEGTVGEGSRDQSDDVKRFLIWHTVCRFQKFLLHPLSLSSLWCILYTETRRCVMATRAMNVKMEESTILAVRKAASVYNLTMTEIIKEALDEYLEKLQNDPFYRLTASVEEASEEESAEILSELDDLTDDDLTISSKKSFEA